VWRLELRALYETNISSRISLPTLSYLLGTQVAFRLLPKKPRKQQHRTMTKEHFYVATVFTVEKKFQHCKAKN
jgi:hypothetical protein